MADENWFAEQLGISPEDVEIDRSFASYGFDAEDLVELVSAIEDLEETLDAEAIRPRSTVATATRYLCKLSGADDEDVGEEEPGARSTWTSSHATSGLQ